MSSSIELRTMSDAEYSEYIRVAVPSYADEKMKGENLTREQADDVARESFAKLLPHGIASSDQFLRTIVDLKTGNAIGTLWYAKKSTPRPHVWIYDFVVDEKLRGRGIGAETLKLLEIEVRALGIKSIGLHVFGHNESAAGLYEKTGFRTTNRIMVKDLA